MCTKFNPTDDGRRRRPIRNTFSKARQTTAYSECSSPSYSLQPARRWQRVRPRIDPKQLTHSHSTRSVKLLPAPPLHWMEFTTYVPWGILATTVQIDRPPPPPPTTMAIHSVIICRLAGWLCRGTCVVPSVELAINITLYRVVFDYIIIDATAFHSLLVPMRTVLQLHFDLRPSTFFCRANRLHLHSSLCVWRACEGLCSMDGWCRTNAKYGKRRRRT